MINSIRVKPDFSPERAFFLCEEFVVVMSKKGFDLNVRPRSWKRLPLSMLPIYAPLTDSSAHAVERKTNARPERSVSALAQIRKTTQAGFVS